MVSVTSRFVAHCADWPFCLFGCGCTWHTRMVAGINYMPAEAKALPHEG